MPEYTCSSSDTHSIFRMPDEELDGADEGDFFELLIANERILEWVDQLQTPGNPARKKEIIMQLKELVDSKHSYAEEARRAGVVPLLTRVLSNTEDHPTVDALKGDEEVMDAVSHIMVACSGPMASGGKVSDYTYGPVTVRIREGALGDGLGARVWTVAHILCKELVAHSGFVSGHDVLEIGAGCGVCGVVAAKLGAHEVVLTDVEGPVLRNLRDCVVLNSTTTTTTTTTHQGTFSAASNHMGSLHVTALQPPQPAAATADQPAVVQDDQQPSTSYSVSEPQGPGSKGGAHGSCDAWDADNMLVRKLDWLESLQIMRSKVQPTIQPTIQPTTESTAAAAAAAAAAANGGVTTQPQQQGAGEAPTSGAGATLDIPSDLDPSTFYANDLLRMADDCNLPGELPPTVPPHQQYSRIIGTDIMYEPMHASLVAAVLAHRLAPGGAALLCCAVRQARTFAAFTADCQKWGLRYRKRQVQPATEYGGIIGREEDYEGGFLLMAVDHMACPCEAWHRHDWE